MILIADSGSTKTHWCLLTASGQVSEFRTDGINPIFQSADDIRRCLVDQLLPQMARLLWAGTITHVFFYGAGCTPEKKVHVGEALTAVFPKAAAEVQSDMLGAARGLLGHTPGVACILGTGSGSCAYNGETIDWCVPSLGFILGDEGSGATLGKRLVGDILKNQLSDELKEAFLLEQQTSMAEIIDRVYRQPLPNRYLAALSRFCADHLEDERIHQLVYEHFLSFVRRNLLQYGVHSVSFVGSIAYYYRPILEQALATEGLSLGTVLLDPIPGLIQYHSADARPTTE